MNFGISQIRPKSLILLFWFKSENVSERVKFNLNYANIKRWGSFFNTLYIQSFYPFPYQTFIIKHMSRFKILNVAFTPFNYPHWVGTLLYRMFLNKTFWCNSIYQHECYLPGAESGIIHLYTLVLVPCTAALQPCYHLAELGTLNQGSPATNMYRAAQLVVNHSHR